MVARTPHTCATLAAFATLNEQIQARVAKYALFVQIPTQADESLVRQPCSMRRKRLQHAADTICHMFCGWRLINCKPQIVVLGSGIVRIDVLSGNCTFNDHPISQLSIAEELRHWLLADLKSNHIPVDALSRASLKAKLSFGEIAWGDRTTTEQFFNDGRPVRTGTMHRCGMRCESEVATDDAVYRSELDDVQEWPIGWPAA